MSRRKCLFIIPSKGIGALEKAVISVPAERPGILVAVGEEDGIPSEDSPMVLLTWEGDHFKISPWMGTPGIVVGTEAAPVCEHGLNQVDEKAEMALDEELAETEEETQKLTCNNGV